MTSLPGIKKNNMAAKYILLLFKVLPLLKNVEKLFWQTNSYNLKGDFTKVLRVGLLFDFNSQ